EEAAAADDGGGALFSEDDFSNFELGATVVEEDEAPPPKSSSSSSRSSSSSSSASSSSRSSSSSSSSSSRTPTSRSYEEEDEPVVDLDEEEPRSSYDEEEDPPSRSSSSSSRSSSSRDDDEDPPSRSSSSSSRSSSSRDDDEDRPSRYDEDEDRRSSRDEDEDRASRRTQEVDLDERPARATRKDDEDEKPGITLATRVGYSRLGSLNFLTYGPELGIPLTRSKHSVQLLLGVEGASTQRNFSEAEVRRIAEAMSRTTGEDVDPESINPKPWNSIVPVNLGVQYKFAGGNIHPYVGVDLVVIPNAVDTSATSESGGMDLAFGGRGRAGVDFMVSRAFGFNLNLGVAYLAGSTLGMVDEKLEKGGLVPQLSGGTVFRF
ncbi:MAG TPA: hypothetical protein PKW90_19710, partial [Myxococcota bacterium]|nr:hypothetical protein [Myxococcota bacterium]